MSVQGAGGGGAAILNKIQGRFTNLAKADDGVVDGTEQAVLNQAMAALASGSDDPRVREIIAQVAQRMGLAGAQDTARAASCQNCQGSGCPSCNAGGNSDPMRSNRCGGGSSSSSRGSGVSGLGGGGKIGGGMHFEDMLAAFLFDIIREMQEELKKKMAEYKAMSKSGKGGGAKGAEGGGGEGEDSRQLLFEEIKNMMQKMQQMIQSLSNILNTLHQGAMNSIRNIRA